MELTGEKGVIKCRVNKAISEEDDTDAARGRGYTAEQWRNLNRTRLRHTDIPVDIEHNEAPVVGKVLRTWSEVDNEGGTDVLMAQLGISMADEEGRKAWKRIKNRDLSHVSYHFEACARENPDKGESYWKKMMKGVSLVKNPKYPSARIVERWSNDAIDETHFIEADSVPTEETPVVIQNNDAQPTQSNQCTSSSSLSVPMEAAKQPEQVPEEPPKVVPQTPAIEKAPVKPVVSQTPDKAKPATSLSQAAAAVPEKAKPATDEKAQEPEIDLEKLIAERAAEREHYEKQGAMLARLMAAQEEKEKRKQAKEEQKRQTERQTKLEAAQKQLEQMRADCEEIPMDEDTCGVVMALTEQPKTAFIIKALQEVAKQKRALEEENQKLKSVVSTELQNKAKIVRSMYQSGEKRKTTGDDVVVQQKSDAVAPPTQKQQKTVHEAASEVVEDVMKMVKANGPSMATLGKMTIKASEDQPKPQQKDPDVEEIVNLPTDPIERAFQGLRHPTIAVKCSAEANLPRIPVEILTYNAPTDINIENYLGWLLDDFNKLSCISYKLDHSAPAYSTIGEKSQLRSQMYTPPQVAMMERKNFASLVYNALQ
jgi:hypothetical protein